MSLSDSRFLPVDQLSRVCFALLGMRHAGESPVAWDQGKIWLTWPTVHLSPLIYSLTITCSRDYQASLTHPAKQLICLFMWHVTVASLLRRKEKELVNPKVRRTLIMIHLVTEKRAHLTCVSVQMEHSMSWLFSFCFNVTDTEWVPLKGNQRLRYSLSLRCFTLVHSIDLFAASIHLPQSDLLFMCRCGI